MDSSPEDLDSEQKEKVKSKSACGYFNTEIAIVLYCMYFGPCALVLEQYIFSEISLQYNYTAKSDNTSVCDKYGLNGSSENNILEQKVQGISSQVMLIIGPCAMVPAIFSTLFLGAYSDTRGRKFTLLLPLAGAMVKTAVFAFVIGFKLSFWYLIIGQVLEGLSGYVVTFVMASFAYAADVSPTESRTLKITVVEVAVGLANAVSTFASGYMIDALGFSYTFIVLFGVNLLNVLFVYFVLPESRNNNTKDKSTPSRNFLKTITSSLYLFIFDDGTKRRAKLQLLTVILTVVCIVTIAKGDSQTYFLRGQPLCFSPVQVGYFNGGYSLAQNIGTLFAVKLFGKIIKDIGLLMLGCISGIMHMVLYAFVKNIWMIALVPVVGIFGNTVTPLVRSMCSKLVNPDEQGAVFAVITIAEAVSNIVGTVLFDAVYPVTLYILPGFIFIVMAIVYFIGLILSSVMWTLNKNTDTEQKLSASQDEV